MLLVPPSTHRKGKPDPRLADLQRMRAIATLLLVLMTTIFIVTTATKHDWFWLPYVRAFSEAGMVGACADWFAVVALFRHPLGLPIPHTAIVPNNKERIGPALGRFITHNFLSTKVAHERLAKIDMVGWITVWLGDPANTSHLARDIGLALPQILKTIRGPELRELLTGVAHYGIQSIPAAPFASKLLAIVWAHGEAQALFEQALEFAESSLARHKGVISQKVSEKSSRWVPRWLDNFIADRVMNGLLATVTEMRNPDHPWRLELRKAIERLIADLATDPHFYARGEAIKAELLASPLLVVQASNLWTEIENDLYANAQSHAMTVAQAIDVGLRSLGQWLESGSGRRARLNRWIRIVMLRTLLPRRAEIGSYVSQVVQNWDTTTLVNRLELQVGKDLQYIRINGTLVGGLVGLMIFIATKWIAAI